MKWVASLRDQEVRADPPSPAGRTATRRRILDALGERLQEAPTEPVSVDEIATRAEVPRSTIYLVFGSRSGLFDAP